jgi:hypothetical protein
MQSQGSAQPRYNRRESTAKYIKREHGTTRAQDFTSPELLPVGYDEMMAG